MPLPKDPAKIEEWKRKLSLAGKGRPSPLKGRKRSPEAVEKTRQALIKTCADPLYRKRQSETAKAKGYGKWMKGKKRSAESIEKSRQGNKGFKHSAESKLKISKSKAGVATTVGYRHTAETKQRIARSNTGRGNGMYGKNAVFNAGRGKSGWYRGWHFRSILELSYVVLVLESERVEWCSAELACPRIPYKDECGNDRTYAADFLVSNSRLIEIKPRRKCKDVDVLVKARAARRFCRKRGWTYEIVTPKRLSPTAVLSLVNTGLVVFDKAAK